MISSQPIICVPSELTKFLAELTEFAAELGEFSLLKTVLSGQCSATVSPKILIC